MWDENILSYLKPGEDMPLIKNINSSFTVVGRICDPVKNECS